MFRSAKPRDEPFESLADPNVFIERLKAANPGIDLFSFAQDVGDRAPKYGFHLEPEELAALPLTTYAEWFKNGIGFKVRNKIRKVEKAGVVIRINDLNEQFIRGIMEIYNESPVIQGKRNRHYGKDFSAMKSMLSTFPGQSVFAGAYFNEELIGFIKVVFGKDVAGLMHINSKVAHRDKAPTNALLAKAIEISADRRASCLHFGIWSRRGLGVFKVNHGFEPIKVPRYYVPLTMRGDVMLKLNLHREWRDRLPERWVDSLVELRNRWNSLRHGVADHG